MTKPVSICIIFVSGVKEMCGEELKRHQGELKVLEQPRLSGICDGLPPLGSSGNNSSSDGDKPTKQKGIVPDLHRHN